MTIRNLIQVIRMMVRSLPEIRTRTVLQVTVVKTGDSGAPIGIFVVLAIVAAGAVVVVVLRMKADQKKNAKKKHRNRPDGTR